MLYMLSRVSRDRDIKKPVSRLPRAPETAVSRTPTLMYCLLINQIRNSVLMRTDDNEKVVNDLLVIISALY